MSGAYADPNANPYLRQPSGVNQAIRTRHLLDPEEAANLGRLDPEAIRRVCAEAWPEARTPDELQDALSLTGFITEAEAEALAKGVDWMPLLAALAAECRATVVVTGERRLWVSAERLAQVQRILPDAELTPVIEAVAAGTRTEAGSRDQALKELVRSRLESLGPVTAAELAGPLAPAVTPAEVELALLALEVEGQALRGRYRSLAGSEEWCDRRLLARIHRYTLKTLREAVEPVSPAAFMRFLFQWQGVGPHRGEGPETLRLTLHRLRGYPVPAGAWEQWVLPDRVGDYLRMFLDQVLATGEFAWLRAPTDPGRESRRPGAARGPIRATPVMFLDRAHLPEWESLLPTASLDEGRLSSAARTVREALATHGAMFFVDLVRATGLLRTHVEAALAELVALGVVTSDGFAGLRALVAPAAQRASFSRPLPRSPARSLSVDSAGRWELQRRGSPEAGIVESPGGPLPTAAVELVARALLDRYGVVFRAVLQREARFLPPWRDLARCYRRLEARGEIRGGRFVAAFSGEQFALPEAVEPLRQARHAGNGEVEVILSAADPLNLTGIVTPGERVPALARNRVLYRNGIPVAVQVAGEFAWLGSPDPGKEWAARNTLLRADPRRSYLPGSSRPS